MSLVVRIKQFKMEPTSRSRFVRLEFRRDIRETKPFRVNEELVTLDKVIEWKLQYPVVPGEVLTIELLSQKWKLPYKMHGMYLLSLDTIIQDKMANITDALTDKSNRNAKAYIDFQVFYRAPTVAIATFVNEKLSPKNEVAQEDLISKASLNSSDEAPASSSVQSDIESEGGELENIRKSIANVERTMKEERDRGGSCKINIEDEVVHVTRRPKLPMKNLLRRTLSFGSVEKTLRSPDSTKRSSLRGMKKIFQFGKNRKRSTCDEELGLLLEPLPATSRVDDYTLFTTDDETDTSLGSLDISPIAQKKRQHWPVPNQVSLKTRDFQVCVTILEARQLAGLNIDPVVCVSVGGIQKYTSIKYSTNSPYYNEYFVFDFNMTYTEMFDKIIKFTVFEYRNILRGKKVLGVFQMDIGTVWNQQDRQFFHKWAMLSDDKNVVSGLRGYLKCNISVIGKGDSLKTPPRRDRDEDDIEANLLVPAGMPIERQRAKFIVKIYRAEGLPQMNSSVLANVKQAITGEALDLVDSYVQVTYAGRSGSTSVVNNSYAPEWNEQIVFTEMFPPLCHRIKIQLKDNNPLGQNRTIGTHFIDLKSISNDGEKGFLPYFGPAFVHLYGSTRDFSIMDSNSMLNSGEGEGIAYRGRILIEVLTELDDFENSTTNVNIMPTAPIIQELYLKKQEYFLHCVIYEANIIDHKIGLTNLHFEISMGNSGNTLDKNNQQVLSASTQIENAMFDEGYWKSTTTEMSTDRTSDKKYYYLRYWDNKEALYIRSIWPDDKQRMYNSNAINKIIESYEYNLSKVQTALQLDMEDSSIAIELFNDALDKVSSECAQYVARINKNIQLGRTKLDKDRLAMCVHELGQLASQTHALKSTIKLQCVKEKLKTAYAYLDRLKFICEDPHQTLPDVFIWLVNGTNRLAYLRIPARDILFSHNVVETGKYCGTLQTFFLKWPGKKDLTTWTIPVKIDVVLWLGLNADRTLFVKSLPPGYTITGHPNNLLDISTPKCLHYPVNHTFQLRCYLYQARSLLGSDTTGLSDPFVRVAICDQSGVTETCYETLNPTWDQTLIFNHIYLNFDAKYIKENPPTIVIEVFDKDNFGGDEFIGRTIARPNIKAFDEAYAAPRFPTKLSWFDLKRGEDNAGELLASFELLELPPNRKDAELPPLPPLKYKPELDPFDIVENNIFKIPTGIRPTLSTYRIEVLFWGLRDLKRVYLQTVEKPRVDIECGGHIISSTVIDNAPRNPNFQKTIKYLDVELPDQDEYRPPLTVRVIDCRNFGRETLVGTHTIKSINKYIYTPKTKANRQAEERIKGKINLEDIDLKNHCLVQNDSVTIENEKENSPLLASSSSTHRGSFHYGASLIQKTLNAKRRRKNVKDSVSLDENEKIMDWWTKYHASQEAMVDEELDNHNVNGSEVKTASSSKKGAPKEDLDQIITEREYLNLSKDKFSNNTLKEKTTSATTKIYSHELEAEKEYDGFNDWLRNFQLYRGKKTSNKIEDDDRVVGVFKGAIKVYKLPLPKDLDDHTIMGCDPSNGFFQGLPNNDPKRVLVRLYVVKATDLHPMDFNGKADPYISLQLGPNKISDKEQYISKQLNPVFGKCFEFEAEFPRDSTLTVKVKDWDLVSTDDTIGETKIDLENRFYSRHRATCGLPLKYEEKGYNCWRDSQKPTQILENLCKEGKINMPIYDHSRVRIGRTIFHMPINNKELFSDPKLLEEQMALQVLHRWHEVPKIGTKLVVEHVEQRSLYNTKQPGVEQGRLEMWIDMFPMNKPPPGPPVNITPRKPNHYELRVIIWNTEDVVLEDDEFFTGEKMSDIYVKGWLTVKEEAQCTDVHYRSLTGEGNFSWRFVHPFQYLEAEERIVTSRKETVFSWDVNEEKIPARYELQVWDADHFSTDDCLGAIILDLNRFPRGAKTANLCSLNMLKKDGTVPLVNIFKQKRIKGWWPFYVKQDNDKLLLTGKVEAEFHLLTKEEAEKMPAGLGRSEPDPLDKPVRADASYLCLLNPLRSIRYVLWRNHKWAIVKGLVIFGIFLMFPIFLYSIPGYLVKKMLGA